MVRLSTFTQIKTEREEENHPYLETDNLSSDLWKGPSSSTAQGPVGTFLHLKNLLLIIFRGTGLLITSREQGICGLTAGSSLKWQKTLSTKRVTDLMQRISKRSYFLPWPDFTKGSAKASGWAHGNAAGLLPGTAGKEGDLSSGDRPQCTAQSCLPVIEVLKRAVSISK